MWLDPSAPWLADHVPGGEVRLPLAAALDLAVRSPARGHGPAARAGRLPGAPGHRGAAQGRALAVEARRSAGGSAGSVDVELWLEPDDPLRGEPRWSPAAAQIEGVDALPGLELGAGDPPRLALDRFYAEHTFHGARMRGIARVEEVGEGTRAAP